MENNYLLTLDVYNNTEEFSTYKLKKDKNVFKLVKETFTDLYGHSLVQFLNVLTPCEYLKKLFGLPVYKELYESITKETMITEFKTELEYLEYSRKVMDICTPFVKETQKFFIDYTNKIYDIKHEEPYDIASRQFRELAYIQDKATNKKMWKEYEKYLNTEVTIEIKSKKQNSILTPQISQYDLQSDNPLALLYTELRYLPRYNSYFINKCEYCGDYFIPTSRSDEKFCSKVYENGTSCRTLGVRNNWKNILEEDPVRKTYNNLYQKKLMYCKRNSSDKDAAIRFDIWKKMAKDVMKKYKNGEFTKHIALQLLQQYEK